jgi:hypothetical protein
LKLVIIETLRALYDQDSSPKNFKYELGKTLKKNPDLVVSGIPREKRKSDLFAQGHQVFRYQDKRQTFFEFMKNIILIKFWYLEQRKIEFKKPCRFSDFIFSKIRKKLIFLDFCFVIFVQTLIMKQNLVLHLHATFWDTGTCFIIITLIETL